jgi:tetratricopeptide (TPR) repeat protein
MMIFSLKKVKKSFKHEFIFWVILNIFKPYKIEKTMSGIFDAIAILFMKRISPNNFQYYIVILLINTTFVGCNKQKPATEFTGSSSCIECHAQFHELWSTSFHGLTMQPITSTFIDKKIKISQEEIFMENGYYKAILKDTTLFIQERNADTIITYPVLWALGGKNVYYFLTDFDGGRLQTLPLAFNVKSGLWYNNPESAIRHFPHMEGQEMSDEALPWKHRQYTFNTSCYSCHVSQLSNNFDLSGNSYKTNWKEAGINCETCHGPASEHVHAARSAKKKGDELTDLKLISTKTFTPEQHNASCAPCHAKMRAITPSYLPGDKFFDHYDLITLESTDFYPDGRDLGENYTMTSWHMNPCAKKGELHCVTCHTSSGRYRYRSDDLITANKACTSCHTEKALNDETHTHHSMVNISLKCIDCHMPQTQFGHMTRSDHSFRPPMPRASIEFNSPNACNLCHNDKDAQWAQQQLLNWKKDKGYQNQTMEAANLLIDARTEKWEHKSEIFKAISTNQYGEVYTTSYLRLLVILDDTTKKQAIYAALSFDSPLIRSAAAGALDGYIDEETKRFLLKAAQDEIRLVRLASAIPLSHFDPMKLLPEEQAIVESVINEYTRSLLSRTDDWSAHYNLGNFYQNTRQIDKAIASFETASKLAPDIILPLVNSSYLLSLTGKPDEARVKLEQALKAEPFNEAANYNYGLLMAELQQMDKAENALKNVLKVNNKNASAAYNLAIIVSHRNIEEACNLSRLAYEAEPDQPKYGYSYAFYLNQTGKTAEAIQVLTSEMKAHPEYVSSAYLLINIFVGDNKIQQAIDVCERAIKSNADNEQLIGNLKVKLIQLKKSLSSL